jgi:CrcB protein
MPALPNYLIVFFGAGIGGALRHAVNIGSLRLLGSTFPYGTLAVNVVGSLIMGLMAGWFAHKADPGQTWRLLLTTGFLGGFTTFSTFSLDTALLCERGQLWLAGYYVLASVALSIVGIFGGLAFIRTIS